MTPLAPRGASSDAHGAAHVAASQGKAETLKVLYELEQWREGWNFWGIKKYMYT